MFDADHVCNWSIGALKTLLLAMSVHYKRGFHETKLYVSCCGQSLVLPAVSKRIFKNRTKFDVG
jgi:hypothetical protein